LDSSFRPARGVRFNNRQLARYVVSAGMFRRVGLPGESIPVIVEPIKLPDPVREPEPAPSPEGEPVPPEPVPAKKEPAPA
jgi:hypothetical protein